jgi:predicted AAA+ superfamily ATPase
LNDHTLKRIAEALERLSPPPAPPTDLSSHPAYHWNGRALAPVHDFKPLPLELIVGIDRQKADLIENSRRHASGAAAHDVLLWGARGMGKSALVKSVVAALQEEGFFIALVEAAANQITSMPALFDELAASGRRYLLFVDDISFEPNDQSARLLRSLLEGGVEARPNNVRLCVTSNRRNIVERENGADPDTGGRDAVDDGGTEVKGFVAFDIETTDLKANFGHIIAAVLVPLYGGKERVLRLDDPKRSMS